MTGPGEHIGEALRKAAVARLRFQVIGLAVLAGVGLLLLGAVRDPLSWLIYGAASLALMWGLEQFVQAGPKPVAASPGPTRVTPPSPGREGDVNHSQEREGSSRPTGPGDAVDRLDYLGAFRHELRTPLNAVLGFSDVLLSGIDGEVNTSQREDLEIIRASGIRLRVLLDSALDISQLAEGPLRLDVDRVDLRELLERAAVEATQLWSAKREAQCSVPDRPCVLEVDEARLRRSVVVLADFLATSHRDAPISLALNPSDDHVSIEVSAPSSDRPSLEALPTTEEVLAAEDMSTIRQWPVAVTSELVTLHGGSLYHGSSPSRFLIRLPIGGTR